METYTLLRSFADSWHLLFMFVFFIGVFLFILRPGANQTHRDSANMIFRNDDKPMGGDNSAQTGRHADLKRAK